MSAKNLLLSMGALMFVPTMLSANDLNQESPVMEDTVQDLEGNTYRTVKIGEQVWLAENLRATKFQDGSKINTGFIPEDDQENLLKYGRLYDWHDVADERNICPPGWRVATDEDWKTLERTIGMPEEELDKKGWRGGDDDLGFQLKETQSNGLFKKFDQSLANKYRFAARPAGVKWNGFYITQRAYTEFWTGTSESNKEAIIRTLAYSWWNAHKGEIRRATSSKDYMFSVRCVKI
ncbi:fibrobacter succinogenes major paralogous domain-containing protein [Vibrio sp. HN007]|uniref:fibrobacter succinogenes major paralogous domain-containing protein n=1 Tax=Vibrio iocasae TaxID=3098914 RepID=UPI0035D3ED51